MVYREKKKIDYFFFSLDPRPDDPGLGREKSLSIAGPLMALAYPYLYMLRVGVGQSQAPDPLMTLLLIKPQKLQ